MKSTSAEELESLVQDIVYSSADDKRAPPVNVPVFQDGYYRCIADPSFMRDLRADQGFREVARYPGMAQGNPLMGAGGPSQAIYGGGQYGQAMFVAGEPVMPKHVWACAARVVQKMG